MGSRAASLVSAVALVACLSCAACKGGDKADDANLPPVAPSATWGHAAAPRPVAAASARARSLASPSSTPDPEALAEFLRAAAKASAAPSPGAAIGSDTGLAKTTDPAVRPAPAAPAASTSTAEPNPDQIDRAARAELYWSLTQRCRDDKGAILPPESVEILFRVDDEGRIIGTTISSFPKEKRYEQASLCMRRELSKSSFRAPAGARRTMVTLKLPPID